jgi:predicted metal-binding membrane protein
MTLPVLERLLRRDRSVIMACLAAVALLAWAYLWTGAGMDMSMPGMVMAPTVWTTTTALIMFLMWWVMMIAMMVPSAAPTVLLFAMIDRKQAAGDRPPIGAGVFLAGYLAAWAGFSLVATALQWALERQGLIAMDMAVSSQRLGGGLLIAAGLYQFTPVKAMCLRHCQNPVLFLSSHWRSGAQGAFRMGLAHGIYCLGCCWVLMALLFVGGIMNLVWIAGLAIYVALEKLGPGYPWLGRGAGVVSMMAGLVMLVQAPV